MRHAGYGGSRQAQRGKPRTKKKIASDARGKANEEEAKSRTERKRWTQTCVNMGFSFLAPLACSCVGGFCDLKLVGSNVRLRYLAQAMLTSSTIVGARAPAKLHATSFQAWLSCRCSVNLPAEALWEKTERGIWLRYSLHEECGGSASVEGLGVADSPMGLMPHKLMFSGQTSAWTGVEWEFLLRVIHITLLASKRLHKACFECSGFPFHG